MDKQTTETLNKPAPDAIDLLLTRRSGSAKAMTGPGPDSEQLQQILQAAARVPDHGKLFPWRFIVIEGEARGRFGLMLAGCLQETDPGAASEERLAIERGRFERAPVVVAVVSRVREQIPIPVWEQELSAGAVCQTMLIAAHALGFTASWITEWCAFHPLVQERMGLKPGERIAGFIYIGHPALPLEERVRPDMSKIVTRF
ncbi:MAG TPA: nitroreductase [Rhizomicrobium sp.]|jgi:nitroreductase